MASFSFYCRASKVNRYGYAPVELSIIIEGKRCFINLPMKEKPSVFKRSLSSQKNNEVKEYVSSQYNVVNRAITDIVTGGQPLTADALREYLKYGGFKVYTIKDMFTDFFQLLELRSTYDNLQKYLIVRDEFYSFIGTKDKPLKEITKADIQAFYAHLLKVYKASTAAGKLAKLKCIFHFAVDNNKLDINLFSGIKLYKDKPKIEYLTEGEVDTILQKQFGIDRLDKVKDLFLFMCGSGLSFSDVMELEETDIRVEGDIYFIKKNRKKTGVEFTSILLDFAVDILRKYNFRLIKISNQKTNAYLQEIATLCGINKHLHCHLARKTYATYLLNKGVSMNLVAKTLGHSTTKITEQIYSFYKTDTIVNSVSKTIRGDN